MTLSAEVVIAHSFCVVGEIWRCGLNVMALVFETIKQNDLFDLVIFPEWVSLLGEPLRR